MRLTGTSLFIFGQFIQSVPFHLYSEKLRPSSCSELTELGTKHLLMQAGKLPRSRIRARRMLRGLGLGQNNPRALRAGAANTCLGTGAPTTGPPAQTLWATQPHTQIGCSLASSPTVQIQLGKVSQGGPPGSTSEASQGIYLFRGRGTSRGPFSRVKSPG